MNKQIASDIKAYLHSQKNEIIEFLTTLVELETPSYLPEAQQAVLDQLRISFHELDYNVIQVPGRESGGYLYARPLLREKQKPIQLLIGHTDTVWDVNTLHDMPISLQNGTITGPGIFDMKAGLTQIVFAIKTIKALYLKTKVTPVVLVNSDEEIGSKESTDAIIRLAKIANRAFILEPPLGLEGKLKTSRKGIGRFTITVRGKAAHAGLDPEKGVNAIVELSHQIQQLFAMNDFNKGITVNVGMVEGGISANVVAPESKAVIDVRVLTKTDAEFITEKIYSLKPLLNNVELIVQGSIGRPPMEKNEGNSVLWQLAKANGELLDLELEETIAGGASDGNTTSLYTPTLDGLGTTGDGAHAKHEFIFKDKLIERSALLTLLLLTDPLNFTNN